jgi:predicted lipoprotein with Yx(FWY)xxD motif
MPKRIALFAVLALALAASGVAAAAAVTHRSSASSAASNASAGRVGLHQTKVGKVLATSSGRTLYLFLADKHGKSACYGKCATNWPPLLKKGQVSAAAGVKANMLGTTKRKNGKLQVTYNGHPLYLFVEDNGAGQIAGQGVNFFGGKWFVVDAAGGANKTPPPASGTDTSTTTSTRPTTTDCGAYGCP